MRNVGEVHCVMGKCTRRRWYAICWQSARRQYVGLQEHMVRYVGLIDVEKSFMVITKCLAKLHVHSFSIWNSLVLGLAKSLF